MSDEKFVAVGLLTQRDLELLGSGFCRIYPLADTTDFSALLARIDEVDKIRRNQND